MNSPSTFLGDTHLGAAQNVSPVRGQVCRAFVRGTITGRLLRCGYVVGHPGTHEGTRHKVSGGRAQANRTRMAE